MVFHNFDELIAHVKGPAQPRPHGRGRGGRRPHHRGRPARPGRGDCDPHPGGRQGGDRPGAGGAGRHIPAGRTSTTSPIWREAARKAVALVRAGEADFLMKGKLDTSVLAQGRGE